MGLLKSVGGDTLKPRAALGSPFLAFMAFSEACARAGVIEVSGWTASPLLGTSPGTTLLARSQRLCGDGSPLPYKTRLKAQKSFLAGLLGVKKESKGGGRERASS